MFIIAAEDGVVGVDDMTNVFSVVALAAFDSFCRCLSVVVCVVVVAAAADDVIAAFSSWLLHIGY